MLAHANGVHADPQLSVDGTVVVETVFVAEDGWLALYRNGSSNGSYDGLLGHAAVEGCGGLERDVPVRVSRERWRGFGPNATVHFVVHHHDDGDGDFEPRGDDPVRSSFGTPPEGGRRWSGPRTRLPVGRNTPERHGRPEPVAARPRERILAGHGRADGAPDRDRRVRDDSGRNGR